MGNKASKSLGADKNPYSIDTITSSAERPVWWSRPNSFADVELGAKVQPDP